MPDVALPQEQQFSIRGLANSFISFGFTIPGLLELVKALEPKQVNEDAATQRKFRHQSQQLSPRDGGGSFTAPASSPFGVACAQDPFAYSGTPAHAPAQALALVGSQNDAPSESSSSKRICYSDTTMEYNAPNPHEVASLAAFLQQLTSTELADVAVFPPVTALSSVQADLQPIQSTLVPDPTQVAVPPDEPMQGP